MKAILFSLVWRKWLTDGPNRPLKVVKVLGWRTAIVDTVFGGRKTISPCFKLFGKEFI